MYGDRAGRRGARHDGYRRAGPLHLVAASDATDTDWYAKLADVAPDGSESIITAGALRASHRAVDPARSLPARPYHTHTDPQPIEPGRSQEYDVELWPTAYEVRIRAGRSGRAVASSPLCGGMLDVTAGR